MDGFARQTRQSCHLVAPDRGMGVVVAQASPVYTWEFRVRIGAPLDLTRTGSGLTLLAFQHPDRAADTLSQWGVAEAEAVLAPLRDHLDAIRAQGWREAPSAQVVGVVDLSAPVLGPDGEAAAVLTCAYVLHPGDDARTDRAGALAMLRETAAALSFTG